MTSNCPRCGGNMIRAVGISYPPAFECDTCGYGYVRVPNALIDE